MVGARTRASYPVFGTSEERTPNHRPPIANHSSERAALVHRGLQLTWITLLYNAFEAVVSLAAGIHADSDALIAFGGDSIIELSASLAALWRLNADLDAGRRERVEHQTLRIIGWAFIALAVYVVSESATTLWRRESPDASPIGITITFLSLIVMPLLARAKRRVAQSLSSVSLRKEAQQTAICAWLSAIVLGGLLLNAAFGWWWADPIAALVLAPIIVREGVEALRGESCEDHCR